MLTIIFDSEISKQLDASREDLVHEILSRQRYVKNFYQTLSQNIENNIMKRLKPISEISKPGIDLKTFYDHLQFHPKNKYQEQFIYAVINMLHIPRRM